MGASGERKRLTSSVKDSTKNVFFELSFEGWVWVFQVCGSRNQIKWRALEAWKTACAKCRKSEYVGSVCGTSSTFKWLRHRVMYGRELIENEVGKECREPTRKGFVSYAKEYDIYAIGYWILLKFFSHRSNRIWFVLERSWWIYYGKWMVEFGVEQD